jgi:hypothetical protein
MKKEGQGLDVARWELMPEKRQKYPGRNKKAGFDHCLPVLDRWQQRQSE